MTIGDVMVTMAMITARGSVLESHFMSPLIRASYQYHLQYMSHQYIFIPNAHVRTDSRQSTRHLVWRAERKGGFRRRDVKMNWLCLFRPHGKMSLINIFSPFFVLWRVDLTLHLPKAFCLQLSTWFSMPGSTQQRSQQILEEHHTYLFCFPPCLSVSLRFCFRWTFLPCDLQACLECVSDF